MISSFSREGADERHFHHSDRGFVNMLITRRNSPFWENCLRKNLPERTVRRSSRRFDFIKSRKDEEAEGFSYCLSSSSSSCSSHVPSPSPRPSFLFLPSGVHTSSQTFSSMASLSSKNSAVSQIFLRSNAERRISPGKAERRKRHTSRVCLLRRVRERESHLSRSRSAGGGKNIEERRSVR